MATTNKVLAQPASGDLNWDVPLNANFGVIDAALGGVTTIDVTGITTTQTLTAAQYQKLIIAFTGTLTANLIYQVPSGVGGQWIMTNAATGAFTISFRPAPSGAQALIPVSVTGVTVYSDGTNAYLTGGGGATGGGADQVFFQNSQVVTTSYTITTGKNAMSAGPITINSGVVVTIPSGSVWTIV
jgi:hypothetical protein